MLFTSKGQIYHEFLKFIGSSIYYTTGHTTTFFEPDYEAVPLHRFNQFKEPYPGYLEQHLRNLLKTKKMNTAYIHYLSYSDVVISYAVEHNSAYLGTFLVGPMNISSNQMIQEQNNYKEDVLEYLQGIPEIKLYQIQYLTNIVSLTIESTYYDPSVIGTMNIPEIIEAVDLDNKQSRKIPHHSLEHEEKILQQILLSKKSFKELALSYISKLSNLVAPPLASNPLRSEKNRFITSATIIARAAIKLGMTSDSAFSYSDYFIIKVEECQTTDEVWALQMGLFAFFRKQVQSHQTQTDYNAITKMLLLYISENIGDTSPLKDICNQLNVDYKYASNCFKKDTGLGFNKYFTKKKMEAAKIKLETTNEQIQQISEALGYNNSYYFTRTFKSMYGVSPTKYRSMSIMDK